jgi:hypothetical protein
MYQPILNENGVTKFVQLCAWCDNSKEITQNYRNDGYRTSHGICVDHKEELVSKYKKDYEKKGYIMGSDGVWIAPATGMQHDSGSGI